MCAPVGFEGRHDRDERTARENEAGRCSHRTESSTETEQRRLILIVSSERFSHEIPKFTKAKMIPANHHQHLQTF